MFTYVVEHDFGFAPNPFFGVCSLATCKPLIREHAQVDDIVLATGSKKHGRECHLVYYMVVKEVVTFDEYWTDQRFERKRPSMGAGVMMAVGDNIYHRSPDGNWAQEYSLHRPPGGPVDSEHLTRDTTSDRVLLGNHFAYWGAEGPKIPKRLLEKHEKRLVGGRPVRNRFSDLQISDTFAWLLSLGASGVLGRPREWTKMPHVMSSVRTRESARKPT